MEREKEYVINVDVVISNYNKRNPKSEKMTRKRLAKELKVNVQVFADWKNGRTPKLIYHLLKMMELGKCDFKDLLMEYKK